MSDTLPPRQNDEITSDPPVHAETPVSSHPAAADSEKTIQPVTEAMRRPFSPCGRITLYKSFSDTIAAEPITAPAGQPVAAAAYSSPTREDYILMVHLVPVTEKSREEFKFLKDWSDAATKKRATEAAGLSAEKRILVAHVAVSTVVLWSIFWGGVALFRKGTPN